MGFLLRHRITADDVGRRVSVRYTLPGGRLTDVVGVLEAWEGDRLDIRRRNGEVTHVIASTVVASKVVPPPPARRRHPRGPDDDTPAPRADGR